ncbi:MAG: DUF2236 domain-containing protein [Myxococcales bacterium]|nr:DUF2236 domain-containing protein [Myxococcales bacterium]
MHRLPTRYVHLDAARARFGEARVARFGALFWRGDPLADAAVASLAERPRAAREALIDRCLREGVARVDDAPEAVRAFFAELDEVPFWVDPERIARGGAFFLRAGILGGLVLGTYSLVAGYCSPAGNKPLMFSGRLEDDVPRRLAETSRFVQAVSLPGGMARGGAGFAATVKVRLIHAAVRTMLARSPRWNEAAWGLPINQVDMSGTALLFSYIVLDGLDKFGFHATPQEREDFLHLWRYVAWLIGVDESLRCTSLDEARTLWELLSMTQGPPDDDSRALARALIESGDRQARDPAARFRALRMKAVGYAISRYMLGDAYADGLGYPSKGALAHLIPLFRHFHARAGATLRVLPDLPFATPEAGARYWETIVNTALQGVPASFAMPEQLRV